jgi:hypothetical protein
MSQIVLKTGDTAPTQKVRLVGRDGPANLNGATVVMQVRGRPDVSFPVDVEDAEDGVVRVPRGDLDSGDRTLRTWEAEFEVAYANGDVQTFPEAGYLNISVWSDLDEV